MTLLQSLHTVFSHGLTVTGLPALRTPLSLVTLNRFRSRFNSDSTAGASQVTAPLVLHTPLSLVALNRFSRFNSDSTAGDSHVTFAHGQ